MGLTKMRLLCICSDVCDIVTYYNINVTATHIPEVTNRLYSKSTRLHKPPCNFVLRMKGYVCAFMATFLENRAGGTWDFLIPMFVNLLH